MSELRKQYILQEACVGTLAIPSWNMNEWIDHGLN